MAVDCSRVLALCRAMDKGDDDEEIVDDKQNGKGYELARDIFLVDCWTAQRVSDYNLPHLADQNINEYIKIVAKATGMTEKVEIMTTRGGTPKREFVPKYKLIHTHTARRTGATLMYLSGMDIYDIMKITGYTSPATLKKYIKANELEVVDKIVDKYSYFD